LAGVPLRCCFTDVADDIRTRRALEQKPALLNALGNAKSRIKAPEKVRLNG
jgi:hypothetical protein